MLYFLREKSLFRGVVSVLAGVAKNMVQQAASEAMIGRQERRQERLPFPGSCPALRAAAAESVMLPLREVAEPDEQAARETGVRSETKRVMYRRITICLGKLADCRQRDPAFRLQPPWRPCLPVRVRVPRHFTSEKKIRARTSAAALLSVATPRPAAPHSTLARVKVAHSGLLFPPVHLGHQARRRCLGSC